jgi:hypothetical protein
LAAVDFVAGPVVSSSFGEGVDGVLEVLGHGGSVICVGGVGLINLGVGAGARAPGLG